MKNAYKKILILSLVVILGISGTSVSGAPVMGLSALGASQLADETQIGSSGTETGADETDDENNSENRHSDILFQFREKGNIIDDNLEVEIHLTGDVNSIKMVNTSDEEEIKAPLKEENPVSEDGYLIKDNLFFSQDGADEPIKVVPNLGLGYSISVTEVESNKILESDSKVNFNLPEEGTYTFGLYDSENSLVANLLYDTRTDMLGEINIAVNDGFKIVDDNLQITVDYVVPVSATPQKLFVTLPPFYTLNGVPAPQTGITYKNTSSAFNKAHYEGVEYGDKVTDYFLIEPASLRQSVLEVSFTNTVSGKISFTLTITSSSIQKQNLSALMAFFAENPDKIPLLIVAEAKNSVGETFNSVTFKGTSILTDSTGNSVENIMTYPEKDNLKKPQALFRALAPYAYVPLTKYPQISVPHYPYTDVVRLFPYMENAALGTGETIVDIDGKKYVSVPDNSLAFKYFTTAFNPNSTPYFTLKLPTQNYLKADSALSGGTSYLEYTYKGQRFREAEFLMDDFPLGKALKPSSIIAYKTTTGSWSMALSNSYHIQGKKDQQFKIDVTNTSAGSYITLPTQAELPMVYKDVAITLNIPFELTLKDIEYTTIASYAGHPLLKQMKPYLAEYTTFGGETGIIPVSGDSSSLTIPPEVGHVKLLVFHYDLWAYNINNSYIVTVDIGTKNEIGAPITNNQPVYIRSTFSTASGTLTELYDTPGETTSPFNSVTNYLLVRLVVEEDGVRFGTYSNTGGSINKGDFYTSMRAYNETTTTPNSGMSLSKTDGNSPWKFGFKSVVNQSKDYDDVKIIIEANTEDEKKALSKMAGMQAALTLNTHISKYEIFIKTNLVPEGKTINPTGSLSNVPFGIADNEYVTYVEIRLGTIKGTSFAMGNIASDIGEKLFPASGQMQPTFRTDRYYFTGTAQQEVIRDGETFHLVARIETSSEAKYMNPSSPDFFNDTSTSTANFIPYVDVRFKRYESTVTNWTSGNTFYQGNAFHFSFTPTIQYFLNGSAGSSSSYLGMEFPSYDHRMYLEVAEGFEITSVGGYDFVEKKPLPDKNTNLFVFETSTEKHGGRISLVGYVRPDAPVSNNVTIFENLGFDYQPFKNKYLQPESGDNAYYNSAPYHKVEMTSNPFPNHWGVGGTADTQMYVGITSNTTVNINRANIDKIVLNALVNGVNQATTANFYDHQKTKLSAQGWLSNISDSTTASYRGTFNLPRKGEQTQGGKANGNDTFFTNQYSMYLTGPITYPTSLDNPQVVYFASNGTDLGAAPADWREVAKVQITFDNFLPHESVRVTLPLETDYIKTGLETAVLKAYVGATSSKKSSVDGEFSEELYTDTVLYNFTSYLLYMRIGLDKLELGQLDSTANYIGVTKVYYEENGEEKLLFSGQNGYSNVTVNQDVTRIEVTPNSGFMLTEAKAVGILESKNSDFPRDTGSLSILMEDLISKTPYKYDAALIYTPTLTAKDIVLREDEIAVTEPTIQTYSSVPTSRYSKVFSVEDGTIATIKQDGTIVGVKAGTTTYTYTVTNLLGDEFTVTRQITVLKKAVPDTVFQKELPDGPINTGDEFTFNIWSKVDKSDLTTIYLSESSNSTNLRGFFLPGTKYFVEETAYDSGYTPKELAISYTTSTGIVEETYPVTGATATFTVHSDAEKMDMSFVNDSKRYSLKIEKMLLPLNGNHDFSQEFPVTVTDNKTSEIIFDSSLKGNGTQLELSELVKSRSYTIAEVKAGYELIDVEVVNALGNPAGVTQPVRAGENSFVLTIDTTHEGAKVIVKNEPYDKGTLRIQSVPNLDFGTIINGSVQQVLRTEDVYYSIWDSRVESGDWKLSLKASEMTTTRDGGEKHIFPYHPFKYSKDGISFVTLTPETPVQIKEGATKKGEPIQTENWLANETNGITIQSQNQYTYFGNYQSILTWSLVSAP